MQSYARVLSVVVLSTFALVGCGSVDGGSPLAPPPAATATVPAATGSTGLDGSTFMLPAPGKCRTETSGGTTCKVCTSDGGGVVTYECRS